MARSSIAIRDIRGHGDLAGLVAGHIGAFFNICTDGDAACGINKLLPDRFGIGDGIDTHFDNSIAVTDAGLDQAHDPLTNRLRTVIGSSAGSSRSFWRTDQCTIGIDHGDIINRQSSDSGGNQKANRIGLRRSDRGPQRHHRYGGCWIYGALKGICASIGNMDSGLANMGAGNDGPGQFSLFGAPVGGIKHLRCGAKTGKRIEQFVATTAICRQTLAGQRHTQLIAAVGGDIYRATANFIFCAGLFQ